MNLKKPAVGIVKAKAAGNQNFTTVDCQPCRYLGTALFMFTAAYIFINTRGGVYRQAYKRLPLRAIAVGSAYMSVARFIYLPPFRHLAPTKKSWK